jgi:hypothetical protein
MPTAAADIGNLLLLSMRAMPCARSPALQRFVAIGRAATTRFTFELRMRTNQMP